MAAPEHEGDFRSGGITWKEFKEAIRWIAMQRILLTVSHHTHVHMHPYTGSNKTGNFKMATNKTGLQHEFRYLSSLFLRSKLWSSRTPFLLYKRKHCMPVQIPNGPTGFCSPFISMRSCATCVYFWLWIEPPSVIPIELWHHSIGCSMKQTLVLLIQTYRVADPT